MIPIQYFIQHFTEIWENSPIEIPKFNHEYLITEQIERERNFELFENKIKELQSVGKARQFRNQPEKSFFPVFKGFLETVFDFEKEQLEIILSEEFRNVSKDFFYKAREYGPELTPENIYQGLRNVWIMNGIQLMLNLPVEITPSIFAYSMIYPYSDNYLDDPLISRIEKAEFSKHFNLRLHGEDVIPKNHTESQLFNLVSMFEDQFNRVEFPEVYESLYAIQKGQTKSLELFKSNVLTENDIKNICFEKGGASVLADGYLVAGKLTQKQAQALFGYGVYLQLLDDIQDVKEDIESNTRTIFTGLKKKEMEKFVNKTVHFGRIVLNEMKCFNIPVIDAFLKLMNQSIETMIIESIGLNDLRYSLDYIEIINRFSPLRFDFVRMKRSQSKSQRFSLFRKYFENSSPEKLDINKISASF